MKNFVKLFCILCVVSFAITSCDDEDFTGDSSLVPASPTITIDVESSSYVFTEQDTSVTITATLSELQGVDVAVYLFQSAGDATLGSDFLIDATNSRIVIPANSLSASAAITIMADDVAESTEVFTITIGDDRTSNALLTPQTVDFTIGNYTETDLLLTLEWDATVLDIEGGSVGATDVADIRFLIVDNVNPYTTVVAEADGAAFEELSLASDDLADGEYYLVADFFGVLDLGDQGSVDVGLTLGAQQTGILSESWSFPAVLNTGSVCVGNHYYMASITKSGDSYTFAGLGETPVTPPVGGLYEAISAGTSTDGAPVNNPIADFAYDVTITDNGDGTYEVSDVFAGVYEDWYCAPYSYCFETPVTWTRDPCEDLSSSWVDGFNCPGSLTGTVNADGTLSVSWSNCFGDAGTAEYTLK